MAEPVSPIGQYFNSSVLSVSIIGAFESEIPIDDSMSMTWLRKLFLPISPRFSCIMVKDDNGRSQWRKVTIKLEEHVKVPVFPSGLSIESYDELLQDYLTEIAMEQLPQSRPLWEFHIFKYPTSNAAGTMTVKLHHALGDGYSLMGALFTIVRRADNPSLPLTFPSSRSEHKEAGNNIGRNLLGFLSMFFNTATDFTSSLLKSSVLKDHVSPIRTASEGKEFQPFLASTVSFSLEQIKQMKAKLGGSINDMIVGIVFYGTRLYMESVRKGSSNARSTALVLVNTRVIDSYNYKTVEEMMQLKSDSPWGNHFGFIHIPIPKIIDSNEAGPLKFVSEVKKTIQQKKSSLGIYLTGRLLELMGKVQDSEVPSKYIYKTISNASLVITNLRGPIEKMSLANHPVKGFYFTVANAPRNLNVTIMSYMGNLRLCIGSDKELIDHKLFIKSLEIAFQRFSKAAANHS